MPLRSTCRDGRGGHHESKQTFDRISLGVVYEVPGLLRCPLLRRLAGILELLNPGGNACLVDTEQGLSHGQFQD